MELNLGRRVALDPTNLQYRFEFGVALLGQGHFDRAIPELLLAMNNPFQRWPAMRSLIEAFEAKGMTDQAAKMRERLTREMIE